MAQRIRIYQPDGSDPYTRNMGLCDAQTHIAARDQLDDEAGLLLAFAAEECEGAPATLMNGAWRLVVEDLGDEDHDWSIVYEEGPADLPEPAPKPGASLPATFWGGGR